MTKQNRQRMAELYLKYQRERNPTFPEYARLQFKGKDNTTNGLTACVTNFIKWNGYQAERISNTGRVLDNSKTVTDIMGQRRKIGSTTYIPGTGTKGTADISATIHGMSMKIEIKFGKDRQSEAQKKYQKSIEKAGGVYIIVREFDDFLAWYDDFCEKIKAVKGLLF